MGKFYESKLYHFAQLVYELGKLNVVAVVCSLPVVTAGAAWAALYCGIDAMADGSASPVSVFFASFRKYFKRATLHWLFLLFFLILAAGDLIIFNTFSEEEIRPDPDYCRNISLDIRYCLFIIDKFAGATHLINEMTIVE